MSIKKLNKETFEADLSITNGGKEQYGEVHTPMALVRETLDLLPQCVFSDPNKRWLDSGAGRGNFAIEVYWRLMEGLVTIPLADRHLHIIKNMLVMCEIQEVHISTLRDIFGKEVQIISTNFLLHNPEQPYDFVIGNPPYNANGIQKVPAHSNISKKDDGNSIWFSFIKHAMSIIRPEGYLVYITPLIWMRPGRFNRYDYMISHQIDKIKCLSDTNISKRSFNFYGGQTPVCLFSMKKTKVTRPFLLYDRDIKCYIPYEIEYGDAIPVEGVSLMKYLRKLAIKYGCLTVIKTNMPSKKVQLSSVQNEDYPYPNIRSCLIADGYYKNNADSYDGKLLIEYSNIPLAYNGEPKIVLAHRRLGLPFIDIEGQYGISNRDVYVILGNKSRLEMIRKLLATKLALYIFRATRYRMKFLEKEAFWFIPDPSNIPGFKDVTDEHDIWRLLDLSEAQIAAIQNTNTKNYSFNVIE